MLRRIERVVLNVRTHAAAARELSIGLYEAVAFLARRHDLDAALAHHEAQVERELPGF